jgi:DNA-binding protein H-NS
MAAMQLDKMSFKELADLEVRIKKTIASAAEREKSAFKHKLDALMQSAGITIEDVVELYGVGRRRGARKGAKVAIKYRNPDNKLETWTGRGRQPLWLVAKLGKNGKIEDYLV